MRDGTAGTYFPSPGQSLLSSSREFLPEGDLLLGELHVVADEEALRVLALAVGHDAAVELGDGWQPAAHTKGHSQPGGSPGRLNNKAATSKSLSFNTMGIPARKLRS